MQLFYLLFIELFQGAKIAGVCAIVLVDVDSELGDIALQSSNAVDGLLV